MHSGATFDDSRRYRYTLWRTWDSRRTRVAFVMLNPSTADHRQDDPTIRRCIGFARSWGHGGLLVVNLFAFRTPSPAALARARKPVGPRNDRVLASTTRRVVDIVVAWGVHGRLHQRDHRGLALLANHPRPLLCLGITRDGHPRHPLYLPATTRPRPFPDQT